MPIPTDNLYNMPKLNKAFAYSALALVAVTLWTIWDDYAKPWRDHQRDYVKLQAAVAEMDYLMTQTDEARSERNAARTRLKEAKADTQDRAQEVAKIRAELTELRRKAEPLRMNVADLNAEHLVVKDVYEKNKTLLGGENKQTVKALGKLNLIKDELTKTRTVQEQNTDAQAEKEKTLKAIQSEIHDARKELEHLTKIAADAKKKRDALTSVIQKSIINAPMLDFAAPKGTLAHEEVRQVVLPDIRAEYNFLQSYSVDRCSTCHVGVDQKEFTRSALIKTFEKAIPAINEELKRQNAKPVRVPKYENLDGDVMASWFALDPESQDAWLTAHIKTDDGDAEQRVAAMSESERLETVLTYLLRSVNRYLYKKGLKRLSVKTIRPLLAHPRLDLFVGSDSPHPMSSMGCTVCHEGNGDETDFVFAAHTAKNHHQLEEWEHEFVPHYGAYDFHTIEHYWDTPMLLTKYTSAACTKCHNQTTDLTTNQALPLEIARPIAEGQRLFTTLGCINCHLVKELGDSRRVGPDLTNLAAKTTPEFTAEWIHFPKNYRPSTWMPHYFMQENNGPNTPSGDDPNPVERTRTEAAALTHYLFETSRLNHLKQRDPETKPWKPDTPPKDLMPAGQDARSLAIEHGRALFDTVGCLACHAAIEHQRFPVNADEQIEWIARELGRQGKEQPDDLAKKQKPVERLSFLRKHYPTIGRSWITNDLQDRESLGEDDANKRYDTMSYRDRIVYAMKHFVSDATTLFDAENVEDRPVFTRFAPELSSIRGKFADDDHAVSWLYDWVKNPRHYSSYTKMPSLRLTDREALDMALYLATLNANQAFNEHLAGSNMVDADPAKVDKLVLILLRGQNSEAASKMIMSDEGKLLTDMLVGQLEKSYGPDAAQQAVTAMSPENKKLFYLGSKLMSNYGCYACHLVTGFEKAARPGTELTYWAEKPIAMIDFAYFSPAFDGQRDEKEFGKVYREQDDHLIRFAHHNPDQEILHNHGSFEWHKLRNPRIWDRGKIKAPYDKLKMPNFFLNDHQTDALVTFLLSRRHPLVTDKVRVDYRDTTRGRLARGRHLVRELNCVGCHRIEDNAAVVHQYYRTSDGSNMFDEANAPPWLRGQGAKVQHEWLFKFLGNVEMLRPWLTVRMPSFYLDHEQSEALVEYFAGVSQYEGSVLAKVLGPVHGYIDRAAADPDGPKDRPKYGVVLAGEGAPGEDWHAQDLLEKPADTLVNYAMFNRFPVEDPTDPLLEPDERTAAYRNLANLGTFIADLYNAPYPFVHEPVTFGNEAHFKRGENLLYELKCLACHVLGDPSKRPQADGPVSAPNLNLTFKRLRYDWVLGWLRNPGVIQPGTKMPQLFGPGTARSAFADFGQADRAQKEKLFGAGGQDQIKLLTDFLFSAGAAGYDAVQPPEAKSARADAGQTRK